MIQDVQGLVDSLPSDECGIWQNRKVGSFQSIDNHSSIHHSPRLSPNLLESFSDLDTILSGMAEEIISLRAVCIFLSLSTLTSSFF